MHMFTIYKLAMETRAWAVLLIGIGVINSPQTGLARTVNEIDLPRTEALIRQLTIETHVALASMREETAKLNLEVENLMTKTEENAQLRQEVEILQEENDEQRWKIDSLDHIAHAAVSMGMDCYQYTAADKVRLADGETEEQVCSSYPLHVYTADGADGNADGSPYCNCRKFKGCYVGVLGNYSRTWSRTATGRECQRWDEQTPHKHLRWQDAFVYPNGETYVTAENYCRDPDSEGILWCYTMDPKKRWEQCGIPKC